MVHRWSITAMPARRAALECPEQDVGAAALAIRAGYISAHL
jgi:hypothetical protein